MISETKKFANDRFELEALARSNIKAILLVINNGIPGYQKHAENVKFRPTRVRSNLHRWITLPWPAQARSTAGQRRSRNRGSKRRLRVRNLLKMCADIHGTNAGRIEISKRKEKTPRGSWRRIGALDVWVRPGDECRQVSRSFRDRPHVKKRPKAPCGFRSRVASADLTGGIFSLLGR